MTEGRMEKEQKTEQAAQPASVLEVLLGADVPKPPEPVQYRCTRLSKAYGRPVVCTLRPLSRREANAVSLATDPDVAIVLAGLAEPRMADPAVIRHVCGDAEKYTAEDALVGLFLPGEIAAMATIIQRLSGYLDTSFAAIKKN